MPFNVKDVEAVMQKLETKQAPKRLKGRAGVDVDLDAAIEREAKSLFPQATDPLPVAAGKSLLLPARMTAHGISAAIEDLEDAALGAGQTLMGVPAEQRMTIGDIMRGFGPKTFPTSAELLRSGGYNKELEQNAILGAMAQMGALTGGIAAPIGGLGALAGKVMAPVARYMPKAVPQGVKSLAPHIAAGAGYTTAFGAGSHFGQTREMPSFGEMAAQAALGGTIGGGLGMAGQALAAMVARAAAARQGAAAQAQQQQISPLVAQFQGQADTWSPKQMLDNYRAALTSAQVAGKPLLQGRIMQRASRYGELGDEYGEAVARLRKEFAEIRAKAAEKQKTAATRQAEKQQAQTYRSGEAQKIRAHQQAMQDQRITARQAEFKARIERQDQVMDRRLGERKTAIAEKEAKTGQHTGESGSTYRALYDLIEEAPSIPQLRLLEKDIFDPGRGPKGERLLDRDQQRNLMDQFYRRLKELKKAEGEDLLPGESKGAGGGSKPAPKREQEPAPGEQPPASGEQKTPAREQKINPVTGKPMTPQEEAFTEAVLKDPELKRLQAEFNKLKKSGAAKEEIMEASNKIGARRKELFDQIQAPAEPVAKATEIDEFVAGMMRKTLPPELRNPRNQYKIAVSVDALGRVAKLEQAEVSALKRWNAELHEAAVEMKVKQAELDRLINYALDHPEKWRAKEGDVTRDYEKGALVLAKEGQLDQLILQRKIERKLESRMQGKLDLVRTKLLEIAGKRPGGVKYSVDPDPQMLTVVSGRAEQHTALANGGLEVKGLKKVGPFQDWVEPKGIEDLYDQALRLQGWISHFKKRQADIKAAVGEYDYLDGRKPIDVLEKAFKNLEQIYQQQGDPQAVPAARIWHADEMGYVTTTVYHRPRQVTSFGSAAKDLQAQYKKIAESFKRHVGYDKVSTEAVLKDLGKNMHGMTGIEALPILAMVAGKPLHKAAQAIAQATDMDFLAVGTVKNILRAKPEWEGPKIADEMDAMLGRILDTFFRDEAKLHARIQGAEDLTELLNKFKGVPLNARSYDKHAVQEAVAKGRVSDADIHEALRGSRSALFIRKQYKELADKIKDRVAELDERAVDIRSAASLRPERQKAYAPEDFVNGRLRADVYDRAFHEALKTLHNALTLQGKEADSFTKWLGRVASRKNASIFGNNFRTGFGNFFDAGIPTLLEFNRHLFGAAAQLAFNPRVREAVKRLPILPQADMEYIQLQEALRNRPGLSPQWNKDLLRKAVYKYEDLQSWLATKADPIFHGKERVVSLADRLYSRIGALASIYKRAKQLGRDGNELLGELLQGNTFTPAERAEIWRGVADDLSRLYNSVAPHLNRDLFASSTAGKFLSNYSAPLRRNFRLYWDWMRGTPAEKTKFSIAMAAHVVLAGRGAIPPSVRALLAGAAALSPLVGANEYVEQGFQNLDDLNLLQKGLGIDLRDRMDVDLFTNARVLLDTFERAEKTFISSANKKPTPEAWRDAALTVFGDTLVAFPRLGSFGYDVWRSLGKNLDAAAKGEKMYYVEVGGQLKQIPVAGYTVADALRDWAIPGPPPDITARKRELERHEARKRDAQKEAARKTPRERILIPGLVAPGET